MGDPHERYEELAVGHVLGGLSSTQSAELREHLHGCPICRSRVAELRGIDHDLTAAAREERARVPVRTQEPPRVDPDTLEAPGGPDSGRRVRSGQLLAAILLLLAATVGLAFWNLHLRTAAGNYLDVVTAQSDALGRLADGAELEASFASGVRGLVVTDGEHVTVTMAGLEPLEDGERLVAWLRQVSGPREPSPVMLAGPGQPRDGTLATSLRIDGARELVITREAVLRPTEPRGESVLEVALVADGP